MKTGLRGIKGVTRYNEDMCWNGYTLFTQTIDDQSVGNGLWGHPFLMDMEGNIVHEWKVSTACQLAKLQNDGRLFVMTRDRSAIDQAGFYLLSLDSEILRGACSPVVEQCPIATQ